MANVKRKPRMNPLGNAREMASIRRWVAHMRESDVNSDNMIRRPRLRVRGRRFYGSTMQWLKRKVNK